MALRKLLVSLPALGFSCSAGYALGGGDLEAAILGGGGGSTVSAQLAALSLAVAALQRERNSGGGGGSGDRTIILDHGNGGSGALGTLLGVCSTSLSLAAMYGYCRWKGISLSDLAYVTAKEFRKGSASLSNGIQAVRAVLARTRRELLERLAGVERTVEECGARTDARVAAEGAAIRAEIAAVDGSQQALRDMVGQISENLDTVEQQTRYSSEGIYLLCSVLDREITAVAAGKHHNNNKRLGGGSARALTRLQAHAAEHAAAIAMMGGGATNTGGGGGGGVGGDMASLLQNGQRQRRIDRRPLLLEEAVLSPVPPLSLMAEDKDEGGRTTSRWTPQRLVQVEDDDDDDEEEEQPPMDFTRRAVVQKSGLFSPTMPATMCRRRSRRSSGTAGFGDGDDLHMLTSP
jgi:hypothetical protein